MEIDCNNLSVIEKYIKNVLSYTRFYELKKKCLLTKIIGMLQSINQENILFNDEKKMAFNDNKIEVYLWRFSVDNICLELAFNVNAIYDYIKLNKCSLLRVNASVFKGYFSKSDISNLLDENKINNILMDAYNNHFEYKRCMPIIALGALNLGVFNGIIINGNHRIAGKISFNENVVDMYLIDYSNYNPSKFLLNDDYVKIQYIVNSLDKLSKI